MKKAMVFMMMAILTVCSTVSCNEKTTVAEIETGVITENVITENVIEENVIYESN